MKKMSIFNFEKNREEIGKNSIKIENKTEYLDSKEAPKQAQKTKLIEIKNVSLQKLRSLTKTTKVWMQFAFAENMFSPEKFCFAKIRAFDMWLMDGCDKLWRWEKTISSAIYGLETSLEHFSRKRNNFFSFWPQ